MTRKEPVKNHIRSGNPSRGQASRAAHTASKGTKTTSMPSDRTVSARRKAQNTRIKRMRRKRIRNTIFLLLLLIVLCTAGGFGVYMLKGGDFSTPANSFNAFSEFDNTLTSKEEQRAAGFAHDLCVVTKDVALDSVSLDDSQSGVLLNLSDKKVLYAKGAYNKVYPASITKIMTAMLALKYGNMDHWVIRNIKESAIIGGNQKTIYAVGPNMTIHGNTPYTNKGGSPWGSSNVLAHVSGIYKTNNSVYRDRHGSGYCAKLETHIEKVKVLGLINIKVLAAGSLFLGNVREPITSTKDGPKAINWGIPFTARPKALRYDYKTHLSTSPNRIKQTGFSSASTVAGHDYAVTLLYLQKRHEDARGNITAKRVGTVVVKYGKSTSGWVEGATYEIHYGDIRHMAGYNASLMGLRSTDYARNSKGKSGIRQ